MLFKVIENITRNGVRFTRGDTIELYGEEAERMLRDGFIEKIHKPFGGYKPITDATAAKEGQ